MDNVSVPYVAYETTCARCDKLIKRAIIAIIISVFLLFASNIAWLIAWCQYDYSSSETVTVGTDDGGNANYIGNDGDIVNGTD